MRFESGAFSTDRCGVWKMKAKGRFYSQTGGAQKRNGPAVTAGQFAVAAGLRAANRGGPRGYRGLACGYRGPIGGYRVVARCPGLLARRLPRLSRSVRVLK